MSPIKKKSLFYSLIILLVLAVFLAGYFFYYVPRSTATVQKNGLLILKTASGNIKDNIAARSNFFKNVYLTGADEPEMKKILEENGVSADIKIVLNSKKHFGTFPKKKDLISSRMSISNSSFMYSFREENSGDSVVFLEPISSFLEPLLKSEKKELFNSYALASIDSSHAHILFHDEDISIRSLVDINNLFQR